MFLRPGFQTLSLHPTAPTHSPPKHDQELLLPPPSAGFVVLRVPLVDVSSEDIAFHFERVGGRGGLL